MPQYLAFDPGAGIGGVFQSHTPSLPAVAYIYVTDVAAKLAEIDAAGGKRMCEPMAMPGLGCFGYFTDPSGTSMGLIGPITKEDAAMEAREYRMGQRWEIDSDVPEFERTVVIAAVEEAQPEWGTDEAAYSVYIRFSPVAKNSLAEDLDGLVLSMDTEGLDRSLTALVESEVELPWWWIYGRRLEERSDAPRMSGTYSSDRISDDLAGLFRMMLEQDGFAKQSVPQRSSSTFAKPQGKKKPVGAEQAASPSPGNGSPPGITANAPAYKSSLALGASEAAIAAFEQAVGLRLPDDFRESVSIHDGGDLEIPPRRGELLSLDRIFEQWQMYREWQAKGDYAPADWAVEEGVGPIKPVFWNSKRIHITDNSGDHLTLDLDPPPHGVYGQIIDHSHETGPAAVLAPGWGEFLRQLVNDLESDKFAYLECEGFCSTPSIFWNGKPKIDSRFLVKPSPVRSSFQEDLAARKLIRPKYWSW